MGWAWFIACGLELAWLAAMWLLLPESRPWPATPALGEVPPSGGKTRGRTFFLHCYAVYHGPALLWAVRTRLLNNNRLRPTGFLILGILAGLVYAMSFSNYPVGGGFLILLVSTVVLHIILAMHGE